MLFSVVCRIDLIPYAYFTFIGHHSFFNPRDCTCVFGSILFVNDVSVMLDRFSKGNGNKGSSSIQHYTQRRFQDLCPICVDRLC